MTEQRRRTSVASERRRRRSARPGRPSRLPDHVHLGATDAPFGRLLRAARRRAGLSQQALAEISGLSVDAIAALERGRRQAHRGPSRCGCWPRPSSSTTRRHCGAARRRVRHSRTVRRELAAARAARPDRRARRRRRRARGDARQRGPRCITLTGPGGIGKTRLALEVARQVAPTFAGGAAWVGLEGVTTRCGVPDMVRSALDLRSAGRRRWSPRSSKISATARCCSSSTTASTSSTPVPTCVAALLAGTSGLRVLATSRERLDVGARRSGRSCRSRVRPTTARLSCSTRTRRAICSCTMRASSTRRSGWRRRTLAAVVALCRRLDGLPLALELAAARTTAMTVDRGGRRAGGRARRAADPARATAPPATRRCWPRSSGASTCSRRSSSSCWCGSRCSPTGARCEAAEAVCVGWRRSLAPTCCRWSRRSSTKSLVVRRDHAGGGADRDARHDPPVRGRAGSLRSTRPTRSTCATRRTSASSPSIAGDRARASTTGRGGSTRSTPRQRTCARRSPGRPAPGYAELGAATAGALWRWCYLRGHYAEGRAWLEDALRARQRLLAGGPGQGGDRRGAPGVPAVRVRGALGAASRRRSRRTARWTTAPARRGRCSGSGAIAREQGRYQDAERLHRESIAIIEATHGPERGRPRSRLHSSSSCGCAATSTRRPRWAPRRSRRSGRPSRASGWCGRCSTSVRSRPTAATSARRGAC